MAAPAPTLIHEEMPAFCRRCFRSLEGRKHQLVETVEDFAQEWLSYTPSPDSWSILQVFDHLIRTERSVRESSERNLLQKRARVSMREQLRAQRFLLMFRLPVRVRMPKAVSFIMPGQPVSLNSIVQAWDEERRLLHSFLLQQEPAALHFTAMRHPAIGALNLRDALRFLVVHQRHHEFQLQRLRWALVPVFS